MTERASHPWSLKERGLRRSDSASSPRSMASSDSLKKHGKANQTAKPSNTSLQEVTESLATTTCLREHLNRLFDNPSSPSETIALPGRCCCNCGRPTMPSEDSSSTELVQRMKLLQERLKPKLSLLMLSSSGV